MLSIPSDDKALETSDNDQTLIQVSDADSDGRVIAQSVEGEDDIVDVSMRDTAQTTSTQADASKYVILPRGIGLDEQFAKYMIKGLPSCSGLSILGDLSGLTQQ